ncbi:hypothetical protein V499_08594 [Pseudogymnoascus sp. VKM F-103]|nr:hypothetical protein V499_08594 [Pseudogymnoascus sp. VKM F-103]
MSRDARRKVSQSLGNGWPVEMFLDGFRNGFGSLLAPKAAGRVGMAANGRALEGPMKNAISGGKARGWAGVSICSGPIANVPVANITTINSKLALEANRLISTSNKSSKAIGFRRLVPKMPETTVYFREAHEYSDKPSPKTDEAWNNLLPLGRGYVFVDDAEHYLPEPGETTPWGQIYSVALFHQLHCLSAIRDHYWKLLDSILNHDEKLQDLAETRFNALEICRSNGHGRSLMADDLLLMAGTSLISAKAGMLSWSIWTMLITMGRSGLI